jgi:DNA modification methylase
VTPYWSSSDGRLAIFHGDARDIIPGLDKVGLVITDPPYAIGAGRGEWSATAAVAIGLHEAARRVVKGGSLIAFTTTSGRGIEFTQGAIGRTLPFNRLLTWLKVGGRSRAISPWLWDSVAIMLFGRAPNGRSGSASVFTTPADYDRDTGHPAELPAGLADWLYAPFDADGLTVLDPFMGSGRLLEPARIAGRRAIGIEIEERYCEIAAKRLEDPPLLAAVKAEQGAMFGEAIS